MSSSGVCAWWVIISVTPGKLYSAAHRKNDRHLMMQCSTSLHQTLPEACHKMWTFPFTWSEHTDFLTLILTLWIMVSSILVYLSIAEASAEGVRVALVTDLNVVNLALVEQHQGVGVFNWAFWAVPHHKCPILKTQIWTNPHTHTVSLIWCCEIKSCKISAACLCSCVSVSVPPERGGWDLWDC